MMPFNGFDILGSFLLPCNLIEIVKWLGIYCSTDYLSLYDDDWGCVV